MSLERIEIRNWVETSRFGVGFKNSDVAGYGVSPLIFNDPSVLTTQNGLETNGLHVLSWTGLGHTPIRYITSKSPNQHGEFVGDFRLDPREITLNLRINGCDRADYWAIRQSLIDAIRPNWQRSLVLPGLGATSLAAAYGMVPGVDGPHQLVIHIPQSDGSTVERAVDVFYRDGLTFEAESNEDWDSYSVEETLGLIAYNPIIYDPEYTSLTATADGFGLAAATGVHNGNWAAYPLILINMDNANIAAAPTTYDFFVYMDYPTRQEIALVMDDLSPYRILDTSIAIDLRSESKRVYIVSNTNPTEFDILEDITSSVNFESNVNPDFVNFAIPPAQIGHGQTYGLNEFHMRFSIAGGLNAPLPWLDADVRYHESYIGI